ncbi:MAG: hypothetical protein Q9160_007620 [Pyrenula sp. 1 TL-2023]
MSIDPFSGRNPSYCFVDFPSQNEADRAMDELNGQDILGRNVKIRPGNAKKSGFPWTEPRIKNYEAGGQDSRRTNNVRIPDNASRASNYEPKFDRWSRPDARDHWQKPSDEGRRLYVGNLPRIEPQSAVDTEIQKLFSGFEIGAVSKIISPHPSAAEVPGNHHYLFVDCATPEAADAAVQRLNGADSPWGGQLKVQIARANPNRKVMREQYRKNEGERAIGESWRRN